MDELHKLTKVKGDHFVVNTGTLARRILRGGLREFAPFTIALECQLTSIKATNETFLFYVYASSAEQAMDAAGVFLKNWHVKAKKVPNGYPKPVNFGAAVQIEDKQFRMIWQQAVNEGKEVCFYGPKNDPVGFHIKPQLRLITSLNTL